MSGVCFTMCVLLNVICPVCSAQGKKPSAVYSDNSSVGQLIMLPIQWASIRPLKTFFSGFAAGVVNGVNQKIYICGFIVRVWEIKACKQTRTPSRT